MNYQLLKISSKAKTVRVGFSLLYKDAAGTWIKVPKIFASPGAAQSFAKERKYTTIHTEGIRVSVRPVFEPTKQSGKVKRGNS